MPHVTPIAEIANLRPETVIDALSGKIKTIYDWKNGENAQGPWSFQTLVLEDQTGEIKVKLKNREALSKSDKGKTITIESQQNSKNQWVGVKASDDEYDGKTTRIVMVTGHAELVFPQGGGAHHEAPRTNGTSHQEQPPANRPAETAQHTTAPARASEPFDARRSARLYFASYFNAYEMALGAAQAYSKRWQTLYGIGLDSEKVKEIATGAMIQFSRDMDVKVMPHSPTPLPATQPAATPAPAAQQQPKPQPPKKEPEYGDIADDIPF